MKNETHVYGILAKKKKKKKKPDPNLRVSTPWIALALVFKGIAGIYFFVLVCLFVF